MDEPGESKGTPRMYVLGGQCRGFSEIALSPISDHILVSRTIGLSGSPAPGGASCRLKSGRYAEDQKSPF